MDRVVSLLEKSGYLEDIRLTDEVVVVAGNAMEPEKCPVEGLANDDLMSVPPTASMN